MESRKVIRRSLQYIEENLEKPLNISEISMEMGYSEYYFSRIFKAEMNVSVMSYVKKRRLIRASEEILKGSRIIDTAMRFGWESHSGFTKAFRNEFGFCPALLKALAMGVDYLGGIGMEHVFLKRTEEHAEKEELLKILEQELAKADRCVNPAELASVYQYACSVYDGMERYSKDEYITHPLNVAILLAQMNAENYVIYAGMFCDALSKTAVTADRMRENLPEQTANLIVKMDNAALGQEAALQDEDILMIRLAERLHNMRTVEYMPEKVRMEKAKETLDITMFLAKRIGNRKILNELNDLSFKYISGRSANAEYL